MRRNKILLAGTLLLTAGVVLTPGIGSASAYFTTYTGAAGGRILQVGSNPDMEEEFSGWAKTVTVTNSQDSQPIYVRARAFSGGAYELNYEDGSGRWTAGSDGFYYYSEIVNAGESTAPLKVGIQGIPEEDGSLNVVVIYESTPVQYHGDGSPYADWEIRLETLGTADTAGE